MVGKLVSPVRYEGWEVWEDPDGNCRARRQLPGVAEIVECSLARHPHIAYEGSWPHPITVAPRVVVTGACLYSDCWRVQVAPAVPDTVAPRPLVIGLRHDRARLQRYLRSGRDVQTVELPRRMCRYQRVLLEWQKRNLALWASVEEVRYHLPLSVYHGFIDELEQTLGRSLTTLRAQLNAQGLQLREEVKRSIEPLGVKLRFVDPHVDADGHPLSPEAADCRPYLDAWDDDGVVGLEDLAQLTIVASIAHRRGVAIPCRVGLLDVPHPLSNCDRGCDPLILKGLT